MTDKIRTAIMATKDGRPALESIQRYLPANYIARSDVWTAQDVEDAGAYVPGNTSHVSVIVIEGIDEAGWTLDGYVIPRLASGLYSAVEV